MSKLLDYLTLQNDPLFKMEEYSFEETFRTTWNQKGRGNFSIAKEEMNSYLNQQHPGHVYLCFQMNYRIPIDFMKDQNRTIIKEPLGRCTKYDEGVIFTFLAALFRFDDTDRSCSVIAHEFAHFYRHIKGQHDNDEENEEKKTRDLAESWGFIREPQLDEKLVMQIIRWRDAQRGEILSRKESIYFSSPIKS